ncbi:DNA-directed RNA polymerases I and III subunit RPAC2 [Varicellaria rhodocarpa]|nr:DNA-directed RNA polymerases I and III subunit RPAC2 [Varicellaria rhodocarpa]
MSSQPQSQDQPMADAPVNGEAEAQVTNDDIDIGEQRIRVLPGASETAASFEFEGEDHTLGNTLRYMIMKNPDVEFCGYSIPHPSEAKMNIRIQTYADGCRRGDEEGTTVYEVLEKGFDDLADLCDVVEEKFTVAKEGFIEIGV